MAQCNFSVIEKIVLRELDQSALLCLCKFNSKCLPTCGGIPGWTEISMWNNFFDIGLHEWPFLLTLEYPKTEPLKCLCWRRIPGIDTNVDTSRWIPFIYSCYSTDLSAFHCKPILIDSVQFLIYTLLRLDKYSCLCTRCMLLPSGHCHPYHSQVFSRALILVLLTEDFCHIRFELPTHGYSAPDSS